MENNNTYIGYKLRSVSHLLRESIKAKVGKSGISTTTFFILITLHRNERKGKEPLTQKDLCESLNLKAPTISLTLQKMELEGYINRIKSDSDSRNIYVTLTDSGREYAESLRHFFKETDEQIESILTEEEFNQLCSTLDKIYDALKEELK